jgi:hypothetical protein
VNRRSEAPLSFQAKQLKWFGFAAGVRAMFFQATAMSYGKAAKVDVFQMLGDLSLDVCFLDVEPDRLVLPP